MTRDEQIQQKTTDLWLNNESLSYAKAFKDGAEWADAFPNWHKCEDELPEDTDPVLLYISEKDHDEDWMAVGERDFFNDRWKVYCVTNKLEYNVTAWMELPQTPKFD